MAKSRRKAAKSGGADPGKERWLIVLGALGIAALAMYVLMNVGSKATMGEARGSLEPALDEIDAKSREAMRDVLRDAGD